MVSDRYEGEKAGAAFPGGVMSIALGRGRISVGAVEHSPGVHRGAVGGVADVVPDGGAVGVCRRGASPEAGLGGPVPPLGETARLTTSWPMSLLPRV
jgi:hypothetical protein